MPRIYLTNPGSRRGRGDGAAWSTQARPPHFARGEGRIEMLVPPWPWVDVARRGPERGGVPAALYVSLYAALIRGELAADDWPFFTALDVYSALRLEHPQALFRAPRDLRPGGLLAKRHDGTLVPVAAGDTLYCTCSKAAALADRCHLAPAARALADAGWDVLLHGQAPLPSTPLLPLSSEVSCPPES